MELLKGTAPTVEFVHPTADTTTVSAVYSLDGGTVTNISVTTENGVSKCRLPYITNTREISVTWTFTIPGSGSFTETFDYSVVRPYLSVPEVRAIAPGISLEDAAAVEASVRHIINAHTGQKFSLDENKTLTVEGDGENALRLPERLLRISRVNTLTSSLSVSSFIIVSDGWYVKKAWADATPRANPNGTQYWGDINGDTDPFDNTIYHDPDDEMNPPASTTGLIPVSSRPGGIIVAPGHTGRATPWKRNYPFEITGDWGYRTVPEAVKEAARLLINDYACSDSLYRDRYLESIKAADWRLQFSSRAWDSTGNARADHLLSQFVLTDMAVI